MKKSLIPLRTHTHTRTHSNTFERRRKTKRSLLHCSRKDKRRPACSRAGLVGVLRIDSSRWPGIRLAPNELKQRSNVAAHTHTRSLARHRRDGLRVDDVGVVARRFPSNVHVERDFYIRFVFLVFVLQQFQQEFIR